MPEAYFVALARSVLRPMAGHQEHFYQEHLIICSQHTCKDDLVEPIGDEAPSVVKYYSAKGGAFPYWFRDQKQHLEVTENYEPIRQVLCIANPQVIYAFERELGFMVVYVHTPHFHPPGVYAVFESTCYDDERLLACGGEIRFLYYEKWQVPPQQERDHHLLLSKLHSLGVCL